MAAAGIDWRELERMLEGGGAEAQPVVEQERDHLVEAGEGRAEGRPAADE